MESKVKEILACKGDTVHQVSPTSSVLEAIQLMNVRKIGALLVTEKGCPVGMFTERDVLTRVVPPGRDAARTTVEEVMSTDLIVIRPDTSVENAMRIVTEKKRRHLPVVEEGRLLGMISIGDLTRWMVREHENEVETLLEYINGPQVRG